jgi:hypothetical protein
MPQTRMNNKIIDDSSPTSAGAILRPGGRMR